MSKANKLSEEWDKACENDTLDPGDIFGRTINYCWRLELKEKKAIAKINDWIEEANKQADYAKRDGADISAHTSEAMAFAYKSCLKLLIGEK